MTTFDDYERGTDTNALSGFFEIQELVIPLKISRMKEIGNFALPDNARVLDLGCGIGSSTWALARVIKEKRGNPREVHAVDPYSKYDQKTNEKIQRIIQHTLPKSDVRFEYGLTAEELAERSQQYQLVLLSDLEAVGSEILPEHIFSVTARGGYVLELSVGSNLEKQEMENLGFVMISENKNQQRSYDRLWQKISYPDLSAVKLNRKR